MRNNELAVNNHLDTNMLNMGTFVDNGVVTPKRPVFVFVVFWRGFIVYCELQKIGVINQIRLPIIISQKSYHSIIQPRLLQYKLTDSKGKIIKYNVQFCINLPSY